MGRKKGMVKAVETGRWLARKKGFFKALKTCSGYATGLCCSE